MRKEVFHAKATEMGDFYVYFTGLDGKPSYLVATSDLSTKYIQEHKNFKRRSTEPVPEGSVRMWNWKSDNLVTLPLAHIKKLVPMSSVITQNG